MTHDQVWKDLLWSVFGEFLQLFFPDVAQRLDLSRIRPFPKELFTDLPEGARREPDVLVEAHTKDGATELSLVHGEVQTKRERAVPFRMWEYYSLLRLRFRHPVFPVALYLAPGAGGRTQERYTEALFGRELLTFTYAVVGLPDLEAEDYLAQESVLGVALSALMRSESGDRVGRKLRAYERLARSSVDEARKSLLVNVVDRYLKLGRGEEAELVRRTQQAGSEEVRALLTQWEERGIRKGRKEGVAQGKRETLLLLLRHKFGELPQAVVARVERIKRESELDVLTRRVLDARTLEEMEIS